MARQAIVEAQLLEVERRLRRMRADSEEALERIMQDAKERSPAG